MQLITKLLSPLPPNYVPLHLPQQASMPSQQRRTHTNTQPNRMQRSNAVTVYRGVILISLPESAAAQVVGTKRPSGNDVFREMLERISFVTCSRAIAVINTGIFANQATSS